MKTLHVLIGLVLAAMPIFVLAAESESEPDAQTHHQLMEEIIAWGRAQKQKGEALSASSGLVGYADISTRPLQRVGELVEVVPGMVATQHSGEGKANQYYMRGMNLDHGTDFSVYLEGMPITLRAHAHGQGYLDLNFLISEVVSAVHYAKGPYAADRGDFSTAGASSVELYDRLDAPFIEISAGSDGYRRGVSAGSWDIGDGSLLGAVELLRNDGPWELDADVKKNNALIKLTKTMGESEFTGLVTYYDNEWWSTDQVPQRAVRSGAIDRFGFIDPTIGGESTRANAIFSFEDEDYLWGGYISRYKLNLFGNLTYFLEDPVFGDQHEQVDRRWIYGLHGEKTFPLLDNVRLRIGGEFRYDDISDTDLYLTTARSRRQVVRSDDVQWASLGTFAEIKWQATEHLRATAGLRVDISDYNVDANLAVNSGSDWESNFTPKISVAYEVGYFAELYLSWGEGFHSNDVRGRTISVDPLTGDPVPTVPLFVDQEGAEIGIRLDGWRSVAATLTYFWLESDSDLLFVGDSGATEPSDGSERTGIELSFFWNVDQHWAVDVIGSWVDSEFVDVPRGQDHIPNAHGQVIGAGLTYVELEGLTASLRLRHFGEAPLIEDDSVRHGDTSVINFGVSYQFGDWQVGLDLINVLDAEDDDIAYFFESRLSGEATGVEDVHFHPVDPFSFRASIRREL